MRKIKDVVLLVQQLQHGFTKNAKVSPNLTVAHITFALVIAVTVLITCNAPNLVWFVMEPYLIV